jgi:hypothetical protein
MAHVKWLRSITAVDTRFTGYQQDVAYRLRQSADEQGEPVNRIRPRALIVPPGYPDFMSRRRVVRPGPQVVQGRAWSGDAAVTGVDVSTDGAQTWQPAALDPGHDHPWAWRRFTFDWHAAPGQYTLSARARTSADDVQPDGQDWNRGGFANNAIQLIHTTCIST